MPDPSTSLTGYIDDSLTLDGYGSVVDYLLEHVPDLQWPLSIRTYARMRCDPQLAAVERVYTHPVRRRATWAVDGAGCRDEVVQQAADDLGLPIHGADDEPGPARRRGFTWAEHLRLSLLDLPYGHMFFEQAYAEEAGRWRLAQVQERMPQTVSELKLNSDGTLAGLVQEAQATRQQPKAITTKDHRLVYYVNEREGSNYFGRSLLRPAYGMWLIKDQVIRVHATSIRRFGLGILEVQAPPGSTPQQVAEAQRYAANIKATEHSGAGLPAGFTSSLRGLQGSVPDAVEFLNWLDRQMTRMALASLLDMATSENGARALGQTVFDVLMLALQSIADHHAEVGTAQIVVPLVTANWGDDEPAPRIVCGEVGQQREASAADVRWLMEYGGLTADPELEAWLRSRYQMPQIEAAYQPKPATDDTTTGATT